MTGSASEERVNGAMLFAYSWPLFYSLPEVSSSKTDWENAIFVKFIYVTICDLHGHRRSQVMVQNESLYMTSYLWIIVTIGLSLTVTVIYLVTIFVTMVIIFKDFFGKFLHSIMLFLVLNWPKPTSWIILVFTWSL